MSSTTSIRTLRRRRLATALVALVAGPGAGCFPDATEVVVVVDTDLAPSEFGSFGFAVTSASVNGGVSGASFDPLTASLPATMGVVPSGSATEFDVTVTVWPPGVVQTGAFGPGGTGSFPKGPQPLTSRKASQVRFANGDQLLLFLPIARKCLCQGTSCPHALDPECKELIAPALPGFDSSHLPRFVAATTTAP